jgi:hypothetical protein
MLRWFGWMRVSIQNGEGDLVAFSFPNIFHVICGRFFSNFIVGQAEDEYFRGHLGGESPSVATPPAKHQVREIALHLRAFPQLDDPVHDATELGFQLMGIF